MVIENGLNYKAEKMKIFIFTFLIVAAIEGFLASFTTIYKHVKDIDPFKMSPLEMKILNGEANFNERCQYFFLGFISSPLNGLYYLIAGIITFLIYVFT